jgi:transposase
MDTARIREGIRKMRFSTILDRWDAGEMAQETAAELLGMSVRSFQRWKERGGRRGGLVDRRGGPSPRRVPAEELERMLGLYRDSTPTSRSSTSTNRCKSGTITSSAIR